MKREGRKNNGHASFWPQRDYVDGGFAEKAGKGARSKIKNNVFALYAFSVFDCDGVFDSGHATIEAAQHASHRLLPGNIVVNRAGVVLSVGVKNHVMSFNDQPGRPAGDSVLN